jgi:hypothetical protein
VGSVGVLVVVSFFDSLWNSRIQARTRRMHLLCVYHDDDQYNAVSNALSAYCRITRLPAGQRSRHEDYASYDAVLAVGNYDSSVLQHAFDGVRLHHAALYHIPSSSFLEHAHYSPTNLY